MTARPPYRILYVHHRPELGGAPASLSNLLSALDRDLFEPHVYCPEGPVTRLFEAAGATVHTGPVAAFTHIWASTYRGRRWLLFANELKKLRSHITALAATLEDGHFDLVHLNDSPLVPAAWLARRKSLPVVWHLRSALPDVEGRRSSAIRKAVSTWGTHSIAITRDVARSFEDPCATVVPNTVDLNRFRPGDAVPARTRLQLPRDGHIVTFVGFLYPSKGYRDFIVAADLLRRRGVEATFLIVGGPVRGPEFFETGLGRAAGALGLARDFGREAVDLVDSRGLQGVVRFLPFIEDTAAL